MEKHLFPVQKRLSDDGVGEILFCGIGFKKTVYRYLDKMEKACLIDWVKRYNIVDKQAMAYVEKQYAVDTGFRMVNTNPILKIHFFLKTLYTMNWCRETMRFLWERHIRERLILSL